MCQSCEFHDSWGRETCSRSIIYGFPVGAYRILLSVPPDGVFRTRIVVLIWSGKFLTGLAETVRHFTD